MTGQYLQLSGEKMNLGRKIVHVAMRVNPSPITISQVKFAAQYSAPLWMYVHILHKATTLLIDSIKRPRLIHTWCSSAKYWKQLSAAAALQSSPGHMGSTSSIGSKNSSYKRCETPAFLNSFSKQEASYHDRMGDQR